LVCELRNEKRSGGDNAIDTNQNPESDRKEKQKSEKNEKESMPISQPPLKLSDNRERYIEEVLVEIGVPAPLVKPQTIDFDEADIEGWADSGYVGHEAPEAEDQQDNLQNRKQGKGSKLKTKCAGPPLSLGRRDELLDSLTCRSVGEGD
jgi:hypothetical protein